MPRYNQLKAGLIACGLELMNVDKQAGTPIERLKKFCDDGYEGNIGAAALVLGRDEDDIGSMLEGEIPVDEDLEMKVNAIADERGISIG
jgi:hypothetical protein